MEYDISMNNQTSIDAYIHKQPTAIRNLLLEIREIIKKSAPNSVETISYGMPTFKIKGKNLVHFAAAKNHLGFYPTPSAILKFKSLLVKYKSSKGAVQFPYTEPLPKQLIADMVKFRVSEVES